MSESTAGCRLFVITIVVIVTDTCHKLWLLPQYKVITSYELYLVRDFVLGVDYPVSRRSHLWPFVLRFCNCISIIEVRRLFSVSFKLCLLSHWRAVKCLWTLLEIFHSIAHRPLENETQPTAFVHGERRLSILSVPYEIICYTMFDTILEYVNVIIKPIIEAFQFLTFLFKRSFQDVPSSYSGRFNRVVYVIYELSVVSWCILLRWLIFTVFHTTMGFFSLLDLVCKSINRQIRFLARRNYQACAVPDQTSKARRKRGKNHKR